MMREIGAQQVALVAALISGVLGYLGYRRSQKVDKIAEQAGIATASTQSIQQVVDGLNTLVENLQEDNRIARDRINGLDAKVAEVVEQSKECQRQLAELGATLKAMANP